MEGTEPWYASKGVWGGLIAVVAGIAGVFGYTLDVPLQTEMISIITAVVASAGGILAIIGRIRASKKIS